MSDKSERQFSENSGAETIPDIPVALPAPTTPLHMFPSQSLSTASRIIRCRTAKEERYFVRIFCLSEVCCFVKVPGRGLEPLRISPPDPKSGASANFATLASTSAFDLTKIVAHRRSQRQMSTRRSLSLPDLHSGRSHQIEFGQNIITSSCQGVTAAPHSSNSHKG